MFGFARRSMTAYGNGRVLFSVVLGFALFAIGGGPISAADAAPNTVIDSGPSSGSKIGTTSTSFGFYSTITPATFACKKDSGSYASCTSPSTMSGLSEGQHTFLVRATASGQTDPTPASRTFFVDLTPPNIQVNSPVTNFATTTDDTPGWSVWATDNYAVESTECRVDSDSFTDCDGYFEADPLSVGTHQLDIQATDAAENIASTSIQFEVASTLPDVYQDANQFAVVGKPGNANDMQVSGSNGELVIDEGVETLSTSAFCSTVGTEITCPVGDEVVQLLVSANDEDNVIDVGDTGLPVVAVEGGEDDDEVSAVGSEVNVWTSDGDDDVTVLGGVATIDVGDGGDAVDVADAGRDTVECGSGTDDATVDSLDSTTGCETSTLKSVAAMDHDENGDMVARFVSADEGDYDLTASVDSEQEVASIEDANYPIRAGPGCAQGIASTVVDCESSEAPISLVDISTANGNDDVAFDTPEEVATQSTTASGDDSVDGGDGPDTLYSSVGADDFNGGGGVDTYDLSGASASSTISLDGTANDGVSGELDNIGSDVENLVGSKYSDTLSGSGEPNVISGGYGNDTVSGGEGEDTLSGGPGDDLISGGTGVDSVLGGRGADEIRIGDGEIDSADCGSGPDVSVIDPSDTTRACESTTTRSVPTLLAPLDGRVISEDHVSLAFSRDDATGFECSLDEGGYETCTSPLELDELEEGEHSVRVRAVAVSGEPEAVPTEYATDSFTVDFEGPPMPAGTVVWNDSGTVRFDADWADYVNLSVSESGSDLVFETDFINDVWDYLWITEARAWTGCENDTPHRITCDLTGVTGLVINSGDRTDRIESTSTLPTQISGGYGDDTILVAAGDDEVDGGIGFDTVSYANASTGVVLDLDDSGPQFTVGSGTDTLTTVESVVGTDDVDSLTASTGGSELIGGDDDDTLTGREGADHLSGGNGNDTLTGAGGADWIQLGDGVDEVDAGDGDDVIESADFLADNVFCGNDGDYYQFDRFDTIDVDCENPFHVLAMKVTAAPDPETDVTRARAEFEFLSTDFGPFECSVDGGEFEECESPYVTPYLDAGTHHLAVRASNGVWTTDPIDNEFTIAPGMTVELDDGTLSVAARDGMEDGLEISESGSDLIVTNESDPTDLGLVASEPCEETSVNSVSCPMAEIEDVSIASGDENDSIVVDTGLSTSVDAGPGDDVLTGSELSTRLHGGSGSDEFHSTSNGPTVDYSTRSADLSLSLDSTANDGEVGEDDNILIASGAVVGGTGNDELLGDTGANVLDGGPGSDSVEAGSGADEVVALDQEVDDVDCGADADSLVADLADTASGCESLDIQGSTLVTSGPAEGEATANPEPIFEFTNSTATSFECAVDGDSPSSCTSPWTLTELEDGDHSVQIEAFDGSTSLDPTPVTRSFNVDRGALTATLIAPTTGAVTGLRPTVQFVSDGAESVTCVVDAEVTEDCESPLELTEDLEEGEHTVQLDIADSSGFEKEAAASATFEATADLPDTEVSGLEDGDTVLGNDIELVFAQNEDETLSFECKLDSEEYEFCESPWLPSLLDGEHTLTVRAVAENGLIDPTPWTADVTANGHAASATITAGPTDGTPVKSEDVSFEFAGDRESGFECKLDGDSYEACSSPFSPTVEIEGAHTLRVRALEDGLPTGARPAKAEFEIDNTAPTVTPTWGSEGEVITDFEPFEFESDEPGSTFECVIVGAYSWNEPFVYPCENPYDWPGQYWDGSYRLSVEAIDQAGNRSERVFHKFTIAQSGPAGTDDVPPVSSVWMNEGRMILGGEEVWTSDSTPQVFFTASESTTFTCSVDEGTLDPCTSGDALPTLTDDQHTLTVCAEDVNENVGCHSPALLIIVDTEAPATPVLNAMPEDDSPGDIATFGLSWPVWGEKNYYNLDDAGWIEAQSSQTFNALPAGEHSFKYKTVDRAGNESTEGEYEWTATAPIDGPYYSLQVVSPEAGSSYVVWPTPGAAGADPVAASYVIRSCTHETSTSCNDSGDPTSRGVWSDWDAYEAEEGKSDGIVGSPLTPSADMAGDSALVVTYEVQALDEAGQESGSPQSFDAGPWAQEIRTSSTDASESRNLSEDWVAEDEDIEIDANITSDIGSVGIKGIGLMCIGHTIWSGVLPVEYLYPCAQETGAGEGLNIASLGLRLPTVLAYEEQECDLVPNGFGTSILDCPSGLSQNFSFPSGLLNEWAEFPPTVKLFAKLASGQLVLLDNVKLPRIDDSPPAPPETIDIDGVPADDEFAAVVQANWDADGDPFGDDNEAEGSGIREFAIKFRVNGGTWSEEVLQPSSEEWSFEAESPGLAVGDDVEFSIASIDRVGHRSSSTTESAEVEAAADFDESSAPADPALDAGVAAALDDDRVPVGEFYASWSPTSKRKSDEIEINAELFDAAVDKESPGSPISTLSKTCRKTVSCSAQRDVSYEIGSYVVRTSILATTGVTTTTDKTIWSEPTDLDEYDVEESDPEIPFEAGDDALPPGSERDEGAEIDDRAFASYLASISASKNGCYTKVSKEIPFNWKADKPGQFKCRWAFMLGVDKDRHPVRKSPTNKVHLEDHGVSNSYAPIPRSEKFPHSLKRSKLPFYKKGSDLPHRGWPMFDSLGYTRAWVEATSSKWKLYVVDDPDDWRVVSEKKTLKITGTDAKLQGKACFMKRASIPRPTVLGKKRNMNNVSLLKIDGGPDEWKIRLFVPNEAFKVKRKSKLRRTGVGCKRGSSASKIRMSLTDPGVGGTRKRGFVFKQGPGTGDELGRTYKTYNPKTKFGVIYAPVNTNSVTQGGVARGAVPMDGMEMDVMGFTGYCDVNAFTKRSRKGTNDILYHQKGMRWGYGEYIDDEHRTGIYGWVPFSALGLEDGSPDGKDEIDDCAYGPTEKWWD